MTKTVGRAVAAVALVSLFGSGCGSSVPSPVASGQVQGDDSGPPNVVLLVADELPPFADGPLAALAESGVRFPAAKTPTLGGRVSASQAAVWTALLTGLRPDRLGLEEPVDRLSAVPPAGVRVFPELLRRAGYFTVRNGDPRHGLTPRESHPESGRELGQPGLLGAWDRAGAEADWRREPGEPCTVAFGCGGYTAERTSPFFAMFNVEGPAERVERRLEDVLAELEHDGLAEGTVVMAVGARGLNRSAVVRWPGRLEAGTMGDHPLGILDVAPTILALAGAPVPSYMEGRSALGATGASLPSPKAASIGISPDPWTGTGPPVAATPSGYPTGGVFHVAPRVELSCETEDSTIIYTTERLAPFQWQLYTGPFRMRFWTLRFQCGRLGYRDSEVVTYDFDIE